MSKSSWTLLLIIALLIFTASCSVSIKPGYVADDRKTAEQAVSQFHARLDAEQYREIFNDADEMLKKTGSETELLAAMKQTHEKWGNVRQTTQSGANVIMGNPVQVRFVYNTTFEKGDATEAFIWFVRDNKATLVNYKNFPGTVTPSVDR
ncbi:MAG TPA: hypothetical protein VGX92_03535 [Pyrinomonadaceae bacterium]|jgi:hypothetical protein|nr:hypothetical protein [Pyrinomonadaceae bacterium]